MKDSYEKLEINSYPYLYKKDSTGTNRLWYCQIQGGAFRTVSGQEFGKMVTSSWTDCLPKNEGKINATTAPQQAEKEIVALYEKKSKEGYAEKGKTAISFIQPMLAKKYKERVKYLGITKTSDVFIPGISIQPKLDGIRCLVSQDGMFTRKGEVINSCPHIFEVLGEIAQKYNVIFDGELYNHILKDDFEELASLVRKTKNHTKLDFIKTKEVVEYHIYDIITEGTFSERQKKLTEIDIFDIYNASIQIVKTDSHISGPNEVQTIYDQHIAMGYEGSMIRLDTPYESKRSSNLLKLKEFLDEEFLILDVLEGIGNRAGMAGAIELQIQIPDGTQDSGSRWETFRAGIKGGYAKYKEILENKENYIGKKVTVTFQNYSTYGIPRFPVIKDINSRID